MERLSANYGLWVGHFSRGEADPARAIAEIVLPAPTWSRRSRCLIRGATAI
jgi:hypothetical protein